MKTQYVDCYCMLSFVCVFLDLSSIQYSMKVNSLNLLCIPSTNKTVIIYAFLTISYNVLV